MSHNHDCFIRFLKFSPLFKNSTKYNLRVLFFLSWRMRISVNCCVLLNQPYPHLIEIDILLSDSLVMDLLIENLIIKLQCKFTCFGNGRQSFKSCWSRNCLQSTLSCLPFPPTAPLCSMILGTTFKVELTFGINRQTRLFTGLWKPPRPTMRFHEKVNAVFFAFWVFVFGMFTWGLSAWWLSGNPLWPFGETGFG